MKYGRTISKFATAAVAASALILGAPVTANAAGNAHDGELAATKWLDYLEVADTTEGGNDEVFIKYKDGGKIWPVSQAYVQVNEPNRYGVNHSVTVGRTIQIWDIDDIGDDDLIGELVIPSGNTLADLRGAGAIYFLSVTNCCP